MKALLRPLFLTPGMLTKKRLYNIALYGLLLSSVVNSSVNIDQQDVLNLAYQITLALFALIFNKIGKKKNALLFALSVAFTSFILGG